MNSGAKAVIKNKAREQVKQRRLDHAMKVNDQSHSPKVQTKPALQIGQFSSPAPFVERQWLNTEP